MPWDGPSFHKHNGHLTPEQSAHAASVANAVLRRTGDEGMAIRVANAHETPPHRALGGMTSHMPVMSQHLGLGMQPAHSAIHLPSLLPKRDDGGAVPPTPGLQPNTTNAGPMAQNYIQKFSQMSPEQLQETVARLGSSPLAGIAQRVLKQKQMMPPPPAAAQTAQPTPLSDQQSQQTGMQPAQQAARGGAKQDTVPILAAGGEFIIAPEHVARWGDGDVEKGHRALDKFVIETRAKIIKEMRRLKPPVKS